MHKQNNPSRVAAIDLRKEGLAIDEISSRLKIPRGTVYHWVRDIELTANQKAVLISNRGVVGDFARSKAVAANKKKYADIRDVARQKGFEEADGNPIHVAGCMLYWAEGSKRVNQVGFANTDPMMIRKFTEFLRYLGVPCESLMISCQVHSTPLNASKEQCQDFWSKAVGVDKERVKVYFSFDQRGESSRKSRYPHGVGRVEVYDTAIVQRIYGGIEAYAGCKLPIGRKT